MSSSVKGFWSYTHRDNDNDDGRIVRLSERISREFETLTGEQLTIFVDAKDLPWGTEWESSIDAALIETTFFIPVITPLYLKSAQCRREFLLFMGKAESLGVKDLLLPILYSTGPSFNADNLDDDVLVQAKKIQWEDWRNLRLEDESSSAHRLAVNKLAQRLAQIVLDVSTKPISIAQTELPDDGADAPGFLDQMATMEQAFPAWTESILAVTTQITTVNDLTTRAAEQARVSDASGGGASGKLQVILDFARQLESPAQEIYNLGTRFGTEISDINAGVVTILKMAEEQAVPASDVPQVEAFFDTLSNLTTQVSIGNQVLNGYSATIRDMPNASRALRKPYGLLADGVQRMIDGLSVIESWAPRIDEVRRTGRWRENAP